MIISMEGAAYFWNKKPCWFVCVIGFCILFTLLVISAFPCHITLQCLMWSFTLISKDNDSISLQFFNDYTDIMQTTDLALRLTEIFHILIIPICKYYICFINVIILIFIRLGIAITFKGKTDEAILHIYYCIYFTCMCLSTQNIPKRGHWPLHF